MMPMSSVNPLSFSLMTGTKIARSPADPSNTCYLPLYQNLTIDSSFPSCFCWLPFAVCHLSSSLHYSFHRFLQPFFLLILCSMLGPMPSPRVLLNQRLSRCFDVCAPGLVGDCGGCSNVGCTRPWVHHSVSTSGRIGVHWPMIHWPNAWETHTNKQIQKCRVTPVYCGWF